MDFLQHQSDARARSRRLVALYALAVLITLVAVNALSWLGMRIFWNEPSLPWQVSATNSFLVLLFVLGGAWLEADRLSEGGAALALRLGARSPDAYDPREKRLMNICEEVAIAAGVPVPEVFILDHDGINALAAGPDVAHSAIVVTRGAIEKLERRELQGVIAHEMAHILNGDAALDMRLVGGFYGLSWLSMMGRSMMGAMLRRDSLTGFFGSDRSAGGTSVLRAGAPSARGGSAAGSGAAAVLVAAIGAIFFVAGWIGAKAARIAQSAVRRQREFLADASAVRLTRDQDGIVRALRKVAGEQVDEIDNEYADLVAHLWLASATRTGWFDTHPPLMVRIRRLCGRPLPPIRPMRTEMPGDAPSGGTATAGTVAATPAGAVGVPIDGGLLAFSGGHGDALQLVPRDHEVDAARVPDDEGDDVGVPLAAAGHAHVDGARDDRARRLAARTLRAAQDCAAPASVLVTAAREMPASLGRVALLLNAIVAGPVSIVDGDEKVSDPALYDALLWLEQPQAQWLRVPLIELLSARLRSWPLAHRRTLVDWCHDAVLADGRIEKTEWIYFTLVRHRLLPDRQGALPAVSELAMRRALAEIFSMAGHLSEQSARRLRDAVAEAASFLGVSQPASTPDQFGFDALTEALDALCTLPPLKKPRLLRILASLARDPAPPAYAAFLAAVAAAIDCPPLRSLHAGEEEVLNTR